MIDWRRARIKRFIEILGLPRVRDPEEWYKGCFDFWYDRESRLVFFRAGVANRETTAGENDWRHYVSDLNELRPWFSYTGYIRLNDSRVASLRGRGEQAGGRRVRRRGYENPEASKTARELLDDHSLEMTDFSRFEI